MLRTGQEGYYRHLLFLGCTKVKEVMRMSDYELLMIVFTVIGLLITVFALSSTKK